MAARVGLTVGLLTEAAAEAADADGFAAVTASALARRLGVSAASLYAHVRNLEELRTRVTALALTEMADRAAAAIAGRAGRDALFALADAYREYALEHPGRYAAGGVRIDANSVAAAPALRHSDLARAVLRGYGLPAAEHTHAVRMIGSTVNGFIALEASGAFVHSGDTSVSWSRMLEALHIALAHWPAQKEPARPTAGGRPRRSAGGSMRF